MAPLPSLGFIHSTVKLERASRIYYGPGDTVKGSIVLEYHGPEKSPVNEIFGPLQVDVILGGTLKVKDYDDDEHKRKCDCPVCQRRTDERRLCRRTTPLWNGPTRLHPNVPVEYPFAVQFPENPDENVSIHYSAEPLPPSIKADTHILKSTGLAEATYQIAAQVDMHGIDVRVVSRGGPHVIQFEQPGYPPNRDTRTRDHLGNYSIRSKHLLPETQRARGFKALFVKKDELPEFAFSVAITSFPRSIDVDQGLVFQVSVAPDLEASTSTIVPEITMKCCDISMRTLIGIQNCSRDERGIADKGARTKSELLPFQVSPEGPFIVKSGNEMGDERSHSSTKIISTPPVDGIASTLSLHNIVRRYDAQVRLEIMVADQVVTVCLKRSELSVHSPPAPQMIGADMVNAVVEPVPVNSELPLYDSLGSPDQPPPQN